MLGKFVLGRGDGETFRFNLLAEDGEVIATSEAYNSKDAALAGIESVRANAPAAELDDQTGASA